MNAFEAHNDDSVAYRLFGIAITVIYRIHAFIVAKSHNLHFNSGCLLTKSYAFIKNTA